MENIQSSLNLFGGVVTSKEFLSMMLKSDKKPNYFDDIHIDYELGIIIAPSAMHLKKEIISQISNTKLTTNQLNNSSFYKSWKKVSNVSIEQRLRDQVTHYFTTYGSMAFGLDSPDYVYIPTDEFQEKSPETLKLRVIKGYDQNTLISECFNMLKSGIALQETTIQDIINVLVACGYKFTGEEEIKNREAKIYFANLTKILPKNGDDLFRYLMYCATKQTLLVKSDDMINLIKASDYKLELNNDQLVELSKSFNRYKPLWLAFKKKSKLSKLGKFEHKTSCLNNSIVNRIAKLAKSNHVPQPVNVLSSLTSKKFDADTIEKSVKKANIFQIVRAFNAMNYYSSGNYDRYYRIRNGKSYAKVKKSVQKNKSAFPILIDEIKNRVKSKKVYIPEYIDYAFPISEKMYTGNIPKNTKISASYKKGASLLIGVYWKNKEHSDLDLSAVSLDEKIGWNRYWKTDDNGLMYSGDVTSAFDGASEWLHCKKIESEYLINLNAYSAPDNQSYTLIVGYSEDSEIGQNYMIDPNNILFQVESVMDQKQKVIGVVSPNENKDGIEFSIIDQSFGNGIVSSFASKDKIARSAILSQVENCLRLSDVFDIVKNKEEADVVLEPNELSKDSILKLFN